MVPGLVKCFSLWLLRTEEQSNWEGRLTVRAADPPELRATAKLCARFNVIAQVVGSPRTRRAANADR